jgi:hypothetical protein
LGGLRYTCELPKAGLLTPTEAGRFIGLVLGTAKDIAKQRKNIYNRIRIGALKQPKVNGKQMVKAKTVLELIDYYRRKAQARKDRETLRADRG